jgi:hypothetical protein
VLDNATAQPSPPALAAKVLEGGVASVIVSE